MKVIKSFLGFFEGFGLNTAVGLAVVGFVMSVFVVWMIGIPTGRWLGFFISTAPIWLPYILFHQFFHLWMEYIQLDFDLRQGRTTLEIQFPQEVFKSPLAMELALVHMYQTASPDNLVDTYWNGKHPPTFGLEIVSDGGRIHFYINTPIKKFKNMWETQLYSQYPGIVITELPVDYTAHVPWDPEHFGYFSIHYKLKNADAFPIKTYIDYGLDKDPKEEFKIDPMTPTLEVLGSIGPKEKIWVQILINVHRAEEFKTGSLHASGDWREAIKAEVAKIVKRDKAEKEGDDAGITALTTTERDIVNALQRSAGKFAFNTKIRTIYIAKDEGRAMTGERIGAIISMWRTYEDLNRNGIRIAWRTDFDWNWWQDPTGARRAEFKKMELGMYKNRSYLQHSSGDGGFILTTEELATLFHPIGQVALTPTLERIPSARSEAPANLPRV